MKSPWKDPRFLLAAFVTVDAALMLFYILVRFGGRTEILTLIIGLIGGTLLSPVIGTYFGGTHRTTPTNPVNGPVVGTVENQIVNNNEATNQ